MVLCGALFHYFTIKFFPLLDFVHSSDKESRCGLWTILGCTPFLPAFLKLRMLSVYLEKLTNLWRGNKIEPIDMNENPVNELDELRNLTGAPNEDIVQNHLT